VTTLVAEGMLPRRLLLELAGVGPRLYKDSACSIFALWALTIDRWRLQSLCMSITKRTWFARGVSGHKVKHVSFGYSVQIPCNPCPHRTKDGRVAHPDGVRQVREYDKSWTKEDAERARAARLLQPDAARAVAPASRTLGQLAEEYLAYKESRGKRSLSADRRLLNTRLLPGLGAGTDARCLTSAAIAQYERRRSAEVSAWTVHNDLTVLKHMLRLARKWGYIDVVPEIDMPKMPAGRLRFLDEDEIAKLLKASSESRNPYLATIVTIALNTGMRRGEILGLEWERVDLATARITLYQTKSGKPRGIPINRAVYDALVALEPDASKRVGLLFRKRGGDGAWGQIRSAFESVVAKAGLRDFRFHDLRHTFASHLVMRGASLSDVKEILGHADLKMTTRYAHLSPAHLRGAVDRLDGLTPSAQSTKPAQSGVDSRDVSRKS
jgi:integrase